LCCATGPASRPARLVAEIPRNICQNHCETSGQPQKSAIISKDKTPKKPRFGINESKIEGQSYIGCRLGSNEFSSSTIDNLLALFEKYNASRIKITHKGNIIILDVPAINAKNLASDLEKTNFNPFV
jgi:sulfite reductase beta subunit-like hemoprotein